MISFTVNSIDKATRCVSVTYMVGSEQRPNNIFFLGATAGAIDLDNETAVTNYLKAFGKTHYSSSPQNHPLVGKVF